MHISLGHWCPFVLICTDPIKTTVCTLVTAVV